jgi:GDP-L-fucose synthase
MKFDFLYVNDFMRILEIFINNKPKFKNYNICTAKPIELLELANIIHTIHGDKKTKVIAKEEGMKEEYSASNKRFMDEFGKFEFTNFTDSISELYNWYKNDVDLKEYCKTLNEVN